MNQRSSENIEVIRVEGSGTVKMENLSTKEVMVLGVIKAFNDFDFIIHRDIDEPEWIAVSEASTGALLLEYCYPTFEDAVSEAIRYIRSKRYYFATAINSKLVEHKYNLRKRNTCIIQNFLLWQNF